MNEFIFLYLKSKINPLNVQIYKHLRNHQRIDCSKQTQFIQFPTEFESMCYFAIVKREEEEEEENAIFFICKTSIFGCSIVIYQPKTKTIQYICIHCTSNFDE